MKKVISLVLLNQVWLFVFKLSLLFTTWCLYYPQCNFATTWLHWRQFIRLHAASSVATKGFILLLVVLSRTVSTLQCGKLIDWWLKYWSISTLCLYFIFQRVILQLLLYVTLSCGLWLLLAIPWVSFPSFIIWCPNVSNYPVFYLVVQYIRIVHLLNSFSKQIGGSTSSG